jgi:hypothetical protein
VGDNLSYGDTRHSSEFRDSVLIRLVDEAEYPPSVSNFLSRLTSRQKSSKQHIPNRKNRRQFGLLFPPELPGGAFAFLGEITTHDPVILTTNTGVSGISESHKQEQQPRLKAQIC